MKTCKDLIIDKIRMKQLLSIFVKLGVLAGMFLSCILPSQLFAYQISRVNAKNIPFFNNQTLSLVLSSRDGNRISVDGDRIATVYCPLISSASMIPNPNQPAQSSTSSACRADSDQNDPTGSVLLSPLIHEPFTVYVKTEQNRHFALEVNPKAVPGRTIIFEPQEAGSTSSPSWAKSDYESMLVNLTKAMMNGESLEGFGYQPLLGKKQRLPMCMRASIQEVGRYNGDQVIGSVLQYCNLGKTSLTLTPSSFYQHGIRSVAINTQTLAPKSCSFVYEIWSREV